MMNVRRLLLAAALMAAPTVLTPAPAEARGIVFGFGIGVPLYPAYPLYPYPLTPYPYAAYPYGYFYPPAYYPAPVHAPPAYPAPRAAPAPAYTPVPGGAAALGATPAATGQTCYAGAYLCRLERATPAGEACACMAPNGIRAWGRVGG